VSEASEFLGLLMLGGESLGRREKLPKKVGRREKLTEIVGRREIYPPALPPLQMASKTSLIGNSVQNWHVPFA